MFKYGVAPPDSLFQRCLIVSVCAVWLLLVIGSMQFYVGEQAEIAHVLKGHNINTTTVLLDTCEVDGRVVNCGKCGQCSNRKDIQLYEDGSSLTAAIEECSKYSFLFGWYRAEQCLMSKLPISKSCTNCWMLNAECRKSLCFHICAKQHYLSFLSSADQSTLLLPVADKCEECKEMRCEEYLNLCAGATPQRVGIASNPYSKTESCSEVDWNYIRGVAVVVDVDEAAQTGGDVGNGDVDVTSSDNLAVTSEENDEL